MSDFTKMTLRIPAAGTLKCRWLPLPSELVRTLHKLMREIRMYAEVISGPELSYRLCYHELVAQRDKRSISMPPELARAVEAAARGEGKTFSAWVAETVAKRLKLDEARKVIAEWEAENGAFTPEEIARGDARARWLLGLDTQDGTARKSV
jgi:hypothetical protein